MGIWGVVSGGSEKRVIPNSLIQNGGPGGDKSAGSRFGHLKRARRSLYKDVQRQSNTRHADFQSSVRSLLALYFNKLPGRPLPNLHDNA